MCLNSGPVASDFLHCCIARGPGGESARSVLARSQGRAYLQVRAGRTPGLSTGARRTVWSFPPCGGQGGFGGGGRLWRPVGRGGQRCREDAPPRLPRACRPASEHGERDGPSATGGRQGGTSATRDSPGASATEPTIPRPGGGVRRATVSARPLRSPAGSDSRSSRDAPGFASRALGVPTPKEPEKKAVASVIRRRQRAQAAFGSRRRRGHSASLIHFRTGAGQKDAHSCPRRDVSEGSQGGDTPLAINVCSRPGEARLTSHRAAGPSSC
jgi:hypothetical protein